MSCNTPNSNPTNISGLQLFYSKSSCNTQQNFCGTPSSSIVYTGVPLPCTTINTGDTLDDILSVFDTKLCAASANYAGYNTGCLDDDGAITTEQQFVEKASAFMCTLRTDLDAFLDTTFPTYQTSVTNSLNAITNPALTSCAFIGITNTDTLNQVIGKINTAICGINTTHLSLSSVNWSQCFTVSTAPTTIPQAFDLLIDQICSLKADIDFAGGGVLPTFNNSGSCLATPGVADSLVDTVNKIKTRLCQTPTFDINALTWNCVTKPNSNTTDLQSAFQSILNKLDTISQNLPTFNGDFVVTNVDNANTCLGKSVALAVSSSADRYVATNLADTTPGTLMQKLEAGSNITLDDTTTPGKIIISSSGGSSSDELVKVSSSDSSSGYLIDKLDGAAGSYGISTTVTEDVVTNKAVIAASINIDLLASKILEAIQNNQTLQDLFCELKNACPSPCSGPLNVSVTYQSGDIVI